MNKFRRLTLLFLIAGGILLNCNSISIAKDSTKDDDEPDYIMDTSQIGQSEDGCIRSDQLLELGSPTPSALTIEGEQNLRQGSIDRALTVLQRSVEMAPLDMDARILYAQTLEKKLMMQKKNRDPRLFNFVVKQWFFVYKKSEFLDQKMQGMSHLMGLTGVEPKRFENEKKYLAKVLISEEVPEKKLAQNDQPKSTKPKVEAQETEKQKNNRSALDAASE